MHSTIFRETSCDFIENMENFVFSDVQVSGTSDSSEIFSILWANNSPKYLRKAIDSPLMEFIGTKNQAVKLGIKK